MEVLELAESLWREAERINGSEIELIDFDKLEENLKTASKLLKKLKEKDETAERVLLDYKTEIRRMANSLSRLKGENSCCQLIERYLGDENLGYEELSLLRKQVKAEFDKSFSSVPHSKIFYPFTENKKVKERVEEFKV